MLKYVIFSMAITTAQSSDIDPYLDKTLSVAVFPKSDRIGCNWYTAKIVDVKCACGDDTESTHVKLLSYQYIPDSGTEEFFAVSVVNTASDVVEALNKYNTCKCGETRYPYAVYRPVNDKFYAQYMMYPVKEKRIVAVLAARSEVTKTEIEKTIQLVDDLKTRDYGLLCN